MSDVVLTKENGVEGLWNVETGMFTLVHDGRRYFAGSKDGSISKTEEAMKEFLSQQIKKFLEDPKSFKEDHR